MRGHLARLGLLLAALAIAGVPLDGRPAAREAFADQPSALAAPLVAASAAPASAATASATPTATLPATPVPPATAAAPRAKGFAAPESASAAVVLLDDASGTVLFERNAHQSLAPASLTKIATAIVAIEQGDLDAPVDVDVDSRTMRGSTVMGLEPGDRFTLRDLLYGLMLPSGNDAALAIGRHVAGSDTAFVERMNSLLTRLGLQDSHFANPHGLGGVGHYSSAYDLAMLSRYATRLAAYREIAGADMWVARGSRDLQLYSLVSEERWSIAGVDVGKSGYTRTAGRTLVLSAERDGHRLHVVVLNDPQTERVAGALLEWGFANFEWPAATASVVSGGVVASEPTP